VARFSPSAANVRMGGRERVGGETTEIGGDAEGDGISCRNSNIAQSAFLNIILPRLRSLST
ncbi:MAG: hypothetical protein IJO46_14920, partial [Thermoguttaceae bacterium]|nr:hypothetical protein [Thermoguttaceae bacterium]